MKGFLKMFDLKLDFVKISFYICELFAWILKRKGLSIITDTQQIMLVEK